MKLQSMLTFAEAQERYGKWISQFPEGYWPLPKMLAQLTEESGEIAELALRIFGSDGYDEPECAVWREFLLELVAFGHRARALLNKPPKNRLGMEDGIPSETADLMVPILGIANSLEFDLGKQVDHLLEKKLFGRDNDRFKRKYEEGGS